MSTSMFRSFASFNYRVWFIGAVVSNIGAWMQATAQSWVVLTELTPGDAGAMGVTMALQFAPPLLLVSVTGWVADRFDRRRLIMITQSLMLLLAVALGVLVLTGVMTLPIMYGFALALGVITAFDNPARQAFVSDLVARENASNAVALNAASFNTARLIGPAVAGLLIVAIGSGWVFLANAVTFIGMLVALVLMRPHELAPRPKSRGASRLSDGFRYVAGRRDLVVIFTMVFLLGAFGMNFPIFASTMALEFGQEADGFGLLSSVLAIGSLSGALLAARRERARMRVVVLAAGGFALASLASVFAPTYLTYSLTLVLIGFSVVTMLTTANGYVQTTTDPALRGRVLALYMAILLGGTPVGAPIVGWVATEWGPRIAILLSAVAALIACLIGVVWTLASGRVHRHESKRFLLTLDETRPITMPEPVPAEFSDEVASTTPLPLPHHPDGAARGAARGVGAQHPRPHAG
jgi:MFS family permease